MRRGMWVAGCKGVADGVECRKLAFWLPGCCDGSVRRMLVDGDARQAELAGGCHLVSWVNFGGVD